ncbi:hypothetical protein ACTXJ5_14905 [Psychrobacter alimentarius]|uniref:hypothetical protein n=1 Tax=Psychrobacter alimentarius TaxID=261164 RepID=UPI003FD13566
MQKILLSIAILIFSSNAFAVELWQGLESGASDQEIFQKFPSLKKEIDGNLPNGYDQRLLIENYYIFDESFRVTFLMQDNKLRRVLINKSADNPDIFLVLKSDVFNALTMKYGSPRSRSDGIARWYYDGVEIVLVYDSSDMYISYSTSTADSANKL